MSFTVVTARPGGAAASPREWWQVWAERRARWLAGHAALARRVRLVRTVLAWLMPVYLLVLVAVMPDVRAGVRVWLGTLWVVVAWFFLARTKTLTWSGFVRFFSACAVWSMVVGATLLAVSADLGGTLGMGQGAVTFVAGIGEEALKVVPVVVVVTMMSDHLACNARLNTGDAWLAEGSAVPWWLQVPWQWFGQAQYRPAMFVVLFVVCLAVDAFRLAARPAANLVPGPAWAWVAQAGTGLSAWHARSRWPGRTIANALNAGLALVWITGRDLGQTALAHTVTRVSRALSPPGGPGLPSRPGAPPARQAWSTTPDRSAPGASGWSRAGCWPGCW